MLFRHSSLVAGFLRSAAEAGCSPPSPYALVVASHRALPLIRPQRTPGGSGCAATTWSTSA